MLPGSYHEAVSRKRAMESGRVVLVRIDNAYSDGHTSTCVETVPAPTGDLGEWWDAQVWPLTGDGHGIDTGADACHEATILEAGDESLVGQSYEWC